MEKFGSRINITDQQHWIKYTVGHESVSCVCCKIRIYLTFRIHITKSLTPLCPLQSRLQHIYHGLGHPYARVDFNPTPASTLSPLSGTLALASGQATVYSHNSKGASQMRTVIESASHFWEFWIHQCCGFGIWCLFYPGSVIGFSPDPGSQNYIFERFMTIFWVKGSLILRKLTKFFFCASSKIK
jgi:hypothetical protein